MQSVKVRLMVLVGVCSVSFAAILIKLSTATALHNAFFRMLFSTILLIPLVLIDKGSFKGIKIGHLFWMIVSGIALGLHFFTWFISLEHTSIANSMVLICMSPIFTVTGGALLFGTRFQRREILTIAAAIIGGVIMAFHSREMMSGEMFGNAMALLGSFLIAVYLLIGNHVRQEVSTTHYTFVVYGFAAIALGILSFFDNTPLLHQAPRNWGIFLLLAIIPTLLGHSLFSYALKYEKAAFISTAVLFEPVLTILWAALLFREYPDFLQIVGGAVILTALMSYTLGVSNQGSALTE